MEPYRAGPGYNLPIAVFRALAFSLPTVSSAEVADEVARLDAAPRALVDLVLRKEGDAYVPGLPHYAVRIAALMKTEQVRVVHALVL